MAVEASGVSFECKKRHRELLAQLAAAGTRGRSRDGLLEAIYGAGNGSINSLQKIISRMNKPFPGLIVFVEGQYRFGEGVEVDVWMLEHAVHDRSAQAVAAVFDDVPQFAPFDGHIDDEGILLAVERAWSAIRAGWEQLASSLDQSNFRRFERQLVAVANDELLNERLTTAVAASLYRLGRQTEGLALLAQSRQRLREDLGLDPGIEFQRIERAILRHDPLPAERVDPTAHGTRIVKHEDAIAPPRPTPTFVGRMDELAILDDALALVRTARRGRVVLVEGEAGLGKSELVRTFAAKAAEDGLVVRMAAGSTRELLAYEPFVAALPELETHLEDIAHSPDPAVARLLFWREVSRQLSVVARGKPAVLILEDLHDADSQSAMLVRFLASGLPAGVLVVATTRPPNPESTWATVHGDLHGAAIRGEVTVLEMQPFDSDNATDFLREHFPGIHPAQAESIGASLLDASGGSPLVCESLCRSVERPTDLTTNDFGHTPEETFAASLRTRVSQPCQELLGLAGIVGLEFELEMLAEIADQSEDEVLRELDRAWQAGLLRETERVGRFRFDHVLTRDTFVNALSRTHRQRVAARLLKRPASSAAQVRWIRGAGSAIDVERAVDLLLDNQKQLADTMAFAESVSASQLALKLLEDSGREVPLGLVVDLAVACANAGDVELSNAYRKRAFASAHSNASTDQMAEVATAGLPEAEDAGGDRLRLQMLLEVNIDDLREFSRAWFVRCLFRTAWLDTDHELCDRILGDYHGDGFGDDVAGGAMFRADVLVYLAQTGERSLGSKEFEALAAELPPCVERAYIRFQGLIHGVIANEPGASTTLFDDVRAEVVAHGSVRIRWTLELVWVTLQLIGSRTDGPTPDDAYHFGLRHGITDAFQGYGTQRLLQHWLDDTLEVAYLELQLLGEHLPMNVSWRAGKALAAVAAGEFDVAEIERDAALAALRSDGSSFLAGTAAMVLAGASQRAAWTDDVDLIMDVLDRHSGRIEVLGLGSAILGPVDAARAAMARLGGRDELATQLDNTAAGQAAVNGMSRTAGLFREAQ